MTDKDPGFRVGRQNLRDREQLTARGRLRRGPAGIKLDLIEIETGGQCRRARLAAKEREQRGFDAIRRSPRIGDFGRRPRRVPMGGRGRNDALLCFSQSGWRTEFNMYLKIGD